MKPSHPSMRLSTVLVSSLRASKKLGLHFKARPPRGAPDASLCNPQFCSFDVVHKDYVYTQQWVDFLVEKLSDPATYAVILPNPPAKGLPQSHPWEGREIDGLQPSSAS